MRVVAISVLTLLVATRVQAQDRPEDGTRRDTVTIAIGSGLTPRYEGSDKSTFSPVGAVRGSIKGIGFSTVGTTLFVDVIPEGRTGTKFVLGPVIGVDANRSSLKRTRDLQITALGRIKPALDLGAHIGLSRTGVITSAYDNLTFDVAAVHDVSGIHDSVIVTPSINYGTPLSRHAFVGVSVQANYVGRGYAQTYFGLTPTQQLASGLPAYSPGAGIKDVSVGGIANLSLTGDLRHGLSAFALGNYARLVGAFGRSPVVRDRGQAFAALGLAYTF